MHAPPAHSTPEAVPQADPPIVRCDSDSMVSRGSTLVLTRLSKASEFIFISKHEQLGLIQDFRDESALGLDFPSPVVGGHEVGIDGSSKMLLRLLQHREDLAIDQSFPNDHYIDIAAGGVLAFGD